jgi:hypothetical protein
MGNRGWNGGLANDSVGSQRFCPLYCMQGSLGQGIWGQGPHYLLTSLALSLKSLIPSEHFFRLSAPPQGGTHL